jgi:transposase
MGKRNAKTCNGERPGADDVLFDHDYVDENNICRVIDAFIDKQDFAALGFTHAETKETGRFSYSPAVMNKIYLYGYLNRIRSSRKLEAETKRNIEMIWLTEGLSPDDKTISNFRADNSKALKGLFKSFNKLCLKMELFGRKIEAVDGTKIKANNSRKNHHTKDGTQKQLDKINAQIEMKQSGGKGFNICYNVQTASDEKNGLIAEKTSHTMPKPTRLNALKEI